MSGTHGLLQPNRPGYFYITLEESYVTLFKISADKWFELHKNEEEAEKNRNARSAHAVAKAYITDVLVHLSNDLYKATQSEKSLWVFLSFPELESRLHGGVKIRTLKDAMKEMIDDGYVFKRPNRDPRYKALEYRLNLSMFRKELEALPPKLDKNESANLHDGIDDANMPDDSANLHHDSAKLHDDNANLHDDSANMHPIRNIDVTKTKQKTKRKNEGTPANSNPNVSLSHSLSSSLSSEETKPEEKPKVVLTEDQQRIIEFGKKSIFKAKLPEVTEKLKNECAELALHIKTQEHFDSLLGYVKAKLKAPYHLKNMVNALNDWLQVQCLATQAEQNSQPDEVVVTDDELADDMWKIVNAYQCEGEFEQHLKRIEKIRSSYRVSNYDLCDKMVNAYRRAKPDNSNISDFFTKIENSFY